VTLCTYAGLYGNISFCQPTPCLSFASFNSLVYLLGDPSSFAHGANIHPLSSLVSYQLSSPCCLTHPEGTPQIKLHIYIDDINNISCLVWYIYVYIKFDGAARQRRRGSGGGFPAQRQPGCSANRKEACGVVCAVAQAAGVAMAVVARCSGWRRLVRRLARPPVKRTGALVMPQEWSQHFIAIIFTCFY
jgi:hypothetical protein